MSSNTSTSQRVVTLADLLLHLLDPTGAHQNQIRFHVNNVPDPIVPPASADSASVDSASVDPTVPTVPTVPTIPPAPAHPPRLGHSPHLQALLQNLIAHMGAPLLHGEEEEDADAPPAATPATRPPGLAGFATDRENVHTRPAQTETSRAIQILMDPAPETWQLFAKEWTECLGDAESHDVKATQNFLADDEAYLVLVGDHEFRTRVSLQDAFCALWSFARTLPSDLRVALSWELRDLWVLDTSRARLEKVAELLCNWNPALSSENFVSSWLHHWVTHQHDGLLNSIRNSWCEAIAAAAPWHRVIEEPTWTEFRHDVYNTVNFDIRYGDLLRRIWDYALAHPDATKEIGVRLAEEVLDGVGMCPQGKMTRLANVLRGFDARLESVSVLSTREQLQNRMSALRALPMEERKAAAEAVFAELSIPAEEQEPWLEALLD